MPQHRGIAWGAYLIAFQDDEGHLRAHPDIPCAVPKLVHPRWPVVLRSLGCSAVFADQPSDDAPALDPGSDVDSVARLVKRRSLMQRLVRPVAVVMPRVLGQDLAEVLLAENHT